MKLVTVAQAAKLSGKSERSIWRYVQQIEDRGDVVVYRIPGEAKTFVDYDLVSVVAIKQMRGNPRHRKSAPVTTRRDTVSR